ncbi:glycosyltransferase family 2 protein [Limnoraphis robusta Tam1]|uniref:Glycosyltransferase family 2 protein n=1 Tax=Limnoraphis robusta CCNP1315 TaxID=3110306 RepID=A0ABU5TXL5_9CYAN|nr:glycosyltransferase family 2 protein [Limnoraphis robusta]MEA5497266.1 glycosyltransferase family 2 protein [Limnoraphis robusta BA-68 BA1]MEA5519684.1 glycosyltransferase family 2 protein [Limnoraphis robusta CCNP1315]MEA5540151.1 glycosyltransferase family 2 protein [Limnoraphis robusta Tam1]MEA5544822.1 glycosyltransferase family 2 protein [Limnoraphis robusta CCNP1324]
MNPKVSIITPAYNAEQYIPKAIQSTLSQTEPDIEMIVVDDGSTDQTVKIVQEFSDQRLRLLQNDTNRGISYSRNRALAEAKGKWIVPLDADDWYAPERIEKLLQIAEQEDADLVADDLYFIQDNVNQPQGTLFCVAKQDFNRVRSIDLMTLIESNMKPARVSPHLGLTKPLMKREFLSQNSIEYDCRLSSAEDFLLYAMCLLKGGKFIVIPEAYYYYRRSRPGSASTDQKLQILNQLYLVNHFLLQQESVSQNPQLKQLVHQYFLQVEQEMNYYRVIKPIKEKGLLVGLFKTLSDLSLLTLTLKQISYILKRRFSNH